MAAGSHVISHVIIRDDVICLHLPSVTGGETKWPPPHLHKSNMAAGNDVISAILDAILYDVMAAILGGVSLEGGAPLSGGDSMKRRYENPKERKIDLYSVNGGVVILSPLRSA